MSARGIIRLDTTRHSVVVTCTLCPWWQALALSKLEGWKTAARHEEQTHPDLRQARNTLYVATRR